jgi:type IV pilus assembly protein PilN
MPLYRINLLREQQIYKPNLVIIFGISLVFISILVLFMHHYILVDKINYQQERNKYLQQEIDKFKDIQIENKNLEAKKALLIKNIDLVQAIETNRIQIIHLFEEVINLVPDGVFFSRLTQNANKIFLEGVADSEKNFFILIKNFKQSKFLTNPQIYSIEMKQDKLKSSVSHFKLELTQASQ